MIVPAYPKPTKNDPLVLSYSSINAFKQCRKAYELGTEKLIDPGASEVMEFGTDIHKVLADAALGVNVFADNYGSYERNELWYSIDPGMLEVARTYLQNRGPLPGKTISVEGGLYTKICPHVFLRVTFDRMYLDEAGWHTIVDYKSFEKWPTYAIDLDFQGRLYIAAAMRALKTDKVKLQYENIRRSTPGSRNSKGFWSEAECYRTDELVIGRREADMIWAETVDCVKDIVRARREGRFYRSGSRKQFGSPCHTCRFDTLCAAEYQHGELSEMDIQLLAVGQREKARLPA